MTSSSAPVVEFRNISKKFGALHANRDINLSVARGEIHAVAGENGAGKTTLMNVLFGRVVPDAGSVLVRGQPVRLRSPRDAIRAGIGMVHQDLLFFPQLSVLENIIVGSERSRGGVIGKSETETEFLRLRETFGFEMDPGLPAGELSFAGRQQVELMRMLYRGADILIFDEPTSFLGPHEVEKFLDMLRSLRAGGGTVLFISHRLDEVFAVADRITVLRRGRVVETLDAEKTRGDEIARLMVGRDGDSDGPGNGGGETGRHAGRVGVSGPRSFGDAVPPVLDVRGLCVEATGPEHRIEDISFSVAEGEIFGIAGIVGNGQRLLARALSGRARAAGGRIFLDGSDITGLGLEQRLRAGVQRVPENPSEEALLPDSPLWENFLLGRQRENEFQRFGIVRKREIFEFAREEVRENDIAAAGISAPLSSLSGGNRQKVALARALCPPPRLAILEQPSRGLDLFASARMRERIIALSANGTAVILLSYDLDELMSLCDRIAVIFRGGFIGTAKRDAVSREDLGRWMVGIAHLA